jgi:hypothetical protein
MRDTKLRLKKRGLSYDICSRKDIKIQKERQKERVREQKERVKE